MQVAQGLNNGCALVLAYLFEGLYIVLQLVFLQVSVYHVVTSTHVKVAIPQNAPESDTGTFLCANPTSYLVNTGHVPCNYA